MTKISVIIPIYNALEDVKILFDSLLINFNFNLGEILLVNDCSSPETTDYLYKFAEKHPEFQLINNEENLGFVKSCNKGMKAASGDIVVLLNSDTQIPNEFCERIIKCFESNPKIGLASPISFHHSQIFNASANPQLTEQINKKLKKCHKCFYPIISDAEGFCFCIRRDVIEQQGYLDEIWGKGYHEEVDFAFRAITNGWINVLIDDLYVYHKRQASFGKDVRKKLISQNNPIFLSRWEGFKEKYIQENNLLNPMIQIERELFPFKSFFFKKQYINGCKYNFFEHLFSIKNSKDKRHKIISILGIKISIVSKKNINNESYSHFIHHIESINDNVDTFVEYKENNAQYEQSIKPIAFYLPQFHSFKENDLWYGKGFTEWTNVTKSFPLYTGHYQPHLPIDVGFYSLNNDDIMYRQIELAQNYGIYGFSFYYYWFSGRKLMEKPLYNYLKNKDLQFPFCVCWACENWTKLWDGGNKEILFESTLNPNDADLFWNDIFPILQDSRYIKYDGNPLILMYRPNKFDTNILKNFIEKLRFLAQKNGFKNLHILWVITNDITQQENINKEIYGFDGLVEFPPHGYRNNFHKSKNIPIKKINGYINKKFVGEIYDFSEFIKQKKYKEPLFNDNNIYRGIFPMWDNAARKAQSGCLIFDGTTPQFYKIWLKEIIKWTQTHHSKNDQFIFINAWNEWAEGAHLEPDQKYGYAYLQATKEALEETEE